MRRPSDWQARERIRTALDENLFVEAGAGSGKTTELVNRVAALLAAGTPPDTIAAITFTRKAAAELRQRLETGLAARVRGEHDPERRRRMLEAVRHLDVLYVGTIHAFCGLVLREHPFDAGLDPEFEELDEAGAKRMAEVTWHAFLSNPALSTGLAREIDRLGIRLDELFGVYQAMLDYPEVEVAVADGTAPDGAAMRARLSDLAARLLPYLPAEPPDRGWDPVQSALRTLARLQSLPEVSDDALYRELRHLRAGKIVLNRWNGAQKVIKEEVKGVLEAAETAWIQDTVRRWLEYRHARLMALVRPAVAEAKRERERQGRLTYEDLLVQTARLLRERPAARQRLMRRFRYLLVDEFQDTDPVQAEIMFLLSSTDTHEADWRRATPRPGSLFVVGDPKQSIYRFRRADIATYQEVRQRLVSAGGAEVALEASFRAERAVAEALNSAFSQLLPPAGSEEQAQFRPLQAFRTERTVWAGVRLWTTRASAGADIAGEEAPRLAAWIAREVGERRPIARTDGERAAGLPDHLVPADFLLLLPTKRHLHTYAAALAAVGIATEVSGASNAARESPLMWAMPVLDSVADPVDPLLRLGALRSPAFGLSDGDLYRYRMAGGRWDAAPDDGTPGPVADALRALRRFQVWSRDCHPVDTIERIVEVLGLRPWTAAQPLGAVALDRWDAALDHVRVLDRGVQTRFADAVTALRDALEAEDSGQASLAPERRGVRIMNLHKAKGLEAPVVVLACSTAGGSHMPPVHIDRRGPRPVGYFPLIREWDHGSEVLAQPPAWEALAEREEAFLDAERSRLLYVAATRARTLLIVCRSGAKNGGVWGPLADHLAGTPEIEVEAAFGGPEVASAVVDHGRAEAVDSAEDAALAARERATVEQFVLAQPSNTHGSGASAGMGAGWGTAVHRILELTQPGRERGDLEALARRVLLAAGEGPEKAPQLAALALAVWGSAFGARVAAADSIRTEVPFAHALAGTPSAVVVDGVVDLAFREHGAWVLADYKTDIAAEESDAEVAARHGGQVRAYARAWTDIVREPVAEALVVGIGSTGEVRVVTLASDASVGEAHS